MKAWLILSVYSLFLCAVSTAGEDLIESVDVSMDGGHDVSLVQLLTLLDMQPSQKYPADDLRSKWHEVMKYTVKRDKSMMANPKLGNAYGRAVGNLLRNYAGDLKLSEPLDERTKAFSYFDREGVTAFHGAFEEVFFPDTDEDPCRSACEIADSYGEWGNETFAQQPFEMWAKNEPGWQYAISSLQALFFLKASRHCPSAKRALPKAAEAAFGRYRDLVARKKVAVPKAAESLSKIGLADEDLKSVLNFLGDRSEVLYGGEPILENPLASYGNLYFLLFLEEMKTRGELHDQDILGKVARRLDRPLRNFEANAVNRNDGSIWHTYFVAASATAVPHRAVLDRLREIRKKDGACYFNYRPFTDKRAGYHRVAAEMAPRSVTANLALYLESRAKEDRDGLLEALNCFHKRGIEAVVQLASINYHSEKHGPVGSHYLYPNLPYISAAIQALKRDKHLTEAEKAKVLSYEKKMTSLLAGLKRKNGYLRRAGSSSFQTLQESSPSYIYPLAGLAMLQYCPTNAGAAPTGILPYRPLPVRSH